MSGYNNIILLPNCTMLYYVFSGPLSLRAYVPEIKFNNKNNIVSLTLTLRQILRRYALLNFIIKLYFQAHMQVTTTAQSCFIVIISHKLFAENPSLVTETETC